MAAKVEVIPVNMVEEPVVKWSGQGQASKYDECVIYLKKDRQTVAGIIVLEFTGKVESQVLQHKARFRLTTQIRPFQPFYIKMIWVLGSLYKGEN